MSQQAWNGAKEPEIGLPGPLGWILAALRAVPLVLLVFGCLVVLLLVRLIERPLFGLARPITPHITVFVCRNALRILGIGYKTTGRPMLHKGILVANHSSWLDIFSLNAAGPLYFVSKAEVAGWPGIGWLARATGTLFIKRERSQARTQTELMEHRLLAGHKLLFFPEGTSTDGLGVVGFKPTLFASLFSDALRDETYVQPVSVVYHAPVGQEARYYGWWGDMALGPHLLRTLACAKQGRVELHYHDALRVTDFADRKSLSAASETAVRAGHTQMHASANSGLQ